MSQAALAKARNPNRIGDQGQCGGPISDRTAYSGTDVLELMAETQNYNSYLMSLLAPHIQPGARALDFGAGTGTFALPLLQRGVDVVCVEPDDALRARLRESGAKVAASLDQIEAESIDFIYSFNVLEHIPDEAASVRGLCRKLKSEGHLLIYVPAFDCLYSSFDRRVGHLRRYNRKSLSDIAEAAGLHITELRYADSAGFLVALLYRILKDEDGSISPAAVRLYDRFIFPVSMAMDRAISRWIGKNLILLAKKPCPTP